MGKKADGVEIASGQVSKATYRYIKAFAANRHTTVSKVVGEIIEDWYEKRPNLTPLDATAHALTQNTEDPRSDHDEAAERLRRANRRGPRESGLADEEASPQ